MPVGGLGRDFDIGAVIMPVNLATAANTGKRIHMRNYGGVCFVGLLNNGTAAEAVTFDIQQHTAKTGGTSADLDTTVTLYTKSEAEIDGDEPWVRVTQTAASEITNADWDDALEVLMAVEVHAQDLSDDYEWVSVDVADPGTAVVGAVVAVMFGLKEQRRPDRLIEPNL